MANIRNKGNLTPNHLKKMNFFTIMKHLPHSYRDILDFDDIEAMRTAMKSETFDRVNLEVSLPELASIILEPKLNKDGEVK